MNNWGKEGLHLRSLWFLFGGIRGFLCLGDRFTWTHRGFLVKVPPLSLEVGVGVLPLLHLPFLCPVPGAYFFSRSFIFLNFFSPSLAQTLVVSLLENILDFHLVFLLSGTFTPSIPVGCLQGSITNSHITCVTPAPNLHWWLWPIESSRTSFLGIE